MPPQPVQAVVQELLHTEAQAEAHTVEQAVERAVERAAAHGFLSTYRIRRKKLFRQDFLYRNWDKTYQFPSPGMNTR